MESVLEFFNKFDQLSEGAKYLVQSTVHLASFKKGELIVKKGEFSPYMYIIKKGLVQSFFEFNNMQITDAIWMESDVCGDVTAFLLQQAAFKNYQALEDSEIYCVDIRKFRNLFQFSDEISHLGLVIAENYVRYIEKERRAIKQLTPEEKYLRLQRNKPAILQRAPLTNLASYLEIRPETLNKIRTKLKSKRHQRLVPLPLL